MKKNFFVICIVVCNISFSSDDIKQGLFIGESANWFKKECSIEIKLVEKQSPRFGKYKEYDIITKKADEYFSFTASADSAQIMIETGELGTSNGSDTAGQILEVTIDPYGSPVSYKVIDYFTVFGFSKKKTVIDCHSLEK